MNTRFHFLAGLVASLLLSGCGLGSHPKGWFEYRDYSGRDGGLREIGYLDFEGNQFLRQRRIIDPFSIGVGPMNFVERMDYTVSGSSIQLSGGDPGNPVILQILDNDHIQAPNGHVFVRVPDLQKEFQELKAKYPSPN